MESSFSLRNVIFTSPSLNSIKSAIDEKLRKITDIASKEAKCYKTHSNTTKELRMIKND